MRIEKENMFICKYANYCCKKAYVLNLNAN